MVNLKQVETLLKSTQTIINHNKELKKLRGENFNIFSILKVERYENNTHSAFIGELLNPKGSHLKNTEFLKLFLEIIEKPNWLDLESARCTTEFTIGHIDKAEKTGGRVDIFLIDKNGKTICIENKIDAPDQNLQIERYVNYNKGKNLVLYLTKFGVDAPETSRGNYIEGKDYYKISYSEDICNWLIKCMKETYDQPILRETIKQYLILIQKITHQLGDSDMENEIYDAIERNYESAKAISNHINRVELRKVKQLFNELKAELNDKIGKDWIVEVSKDLGDKYAGFNMRHSTWPEDIFINISPQSMLFRDGTILGIIANKKRYDRDEVKRLLGDLNLYDNDYKNETPGFPFFKYVINWGKESKRAELFETDKFKMLKQGLFEEILWLTNGTEEPLSKLKQRN